MKILLLLLTLMVSACATASVSNPVTPERLNAAENAAIVMFAGLNAYKQSCIKRVIPQSCRETIAAIQVYTLQLPQTLEALRAFVQSGDQVNALQAYNLVMNLISNARTIATTNKVPMGVV
jgi:hypothetical protein